MSVYATPFVNLGVETGIYASGDALGEQQSVRLPEHCLLQTVVVVDRDKEDVGFDIVLYGRAPGGTTDNAAYDPTDDELENCLGTVTVSGYKDFNDNAVATMVSVGISLWLPEGVLYFQAVSRGTPTYTATSDLRVRFVVVT